MNDTLLSLAERVEKATGGDRELDEAVARSQGWRDKDYGGAGSWLVPPDAHIRSLPRYTASVDAAMSLVPEGTQWEVKSTGEALVYDDRSSDGSGYVEHEGSAATPALALTAASLRAIASVKGVGNEG